MKHISEYTKSDFEWIFLDKNHDFASKAGFYQDLYNALNYERVEVQKKLTQLLKDKYIEDPHQFKIWNSPDHPIRNFLITYKIDYPLEVKPVKNKKRRKL